MVLFNGILSALIHLALGIVMLVYLPIIFVCRIVYFAFVRPFVKEDLSGKVVLIIGASSGIGEQLAYKYARERAYLVLVARRIPALKSVAKVVRGYGSPDVLVIPADVSDCEESKRVIDETISYFGQSVDFAMNHLVVNAGIFSSCLFEEVTNISAFKQVMSLFAQDVNYWGAVYPTYYALPHLKKSKGNIIASTSIAGRVPTARLSFYDASKGALIRFYETLRADDG